MQSQTNHFITILQITSFLLYSYSKFFKKKKATIFQVAYLCLYYHGLFIHSIVVPIKSLTVTSRVST